MAEHAHHEPAGHGSPDDQYLETPPGAGYEHTDAEAGVMLKFAFWLIVSAVIVHVGLGAMYWLMIRQAEEPQATKRYPMATSLAPRLPPEPRLQPSGANDMYDFRVKEEADLHTYGWVDKNAGTVHIPIDDAMRMMLDRGALQSRPADTSNVAGPTEMFPSDSSSGRVLEKRRQ